MNSASLSYLPIEFEAFSRGAEMLLHPFICQSFGLLHITHVRKNRSRYPRRHDMRTLVLALAAAGALAGAAMLSAPALAAPIGNVGALNAATATLNDVEQAELVCHRWRCW